MKRPAVSGVSRVGGPSHPASSLSASGRAIFRGGLGRRIGRGRRRLESNRVALFPGGGPELDENLENGFELGDSFGNGSGLAVDEERDDIGSDVPAPLPPMMSLKSGRISKGSASMTLRLSA